MISRADSWLYAKGVDFMNDKSQSISRRYLFSGRVQGVGFRWTTNRIAAGFGVAGYVKNLADGRVELMASGASDEVAAFLQAVMDQLGDYVQSVEEEQITASPETFSSFSIRR